MNIASATQVFLGSLSATEMWLGAVKIWSKVIWSKLGATINGDAAGDQLGYSVSLNSAGDVIAVGAIGSDTNGSASGQLKVFAWNGNSWVQRGVTINGDAAGDQLGYSVSLNSVGDVVAVGAIGSDTNGGDSGQLKVFAWNGTAWVQRGATINGDAANNQLGSSVSLSPSGGVVAAAGGSVYGGVKIFAWNGTAWVQRGTTITGGVASISLGTDTTIALGYPNESGGRVRIFEWNGTAWVQSGVTIRESGSDVFYFGYSVSLNSNGRLAVGCPNLLSTASGQVPFVRVYDVGSFGYFPVGDSIRGKSFNFAYDFVGDSVSLSASGNVLAIRSATASSNPYKGALRIYVLSGNSWVQRGSDYSNSNSVSINGEGNIFAYGSTTGSGSAFIYKFN